MGYVTSKTISKDICSDITTHPVTMLRTAILLVFGLLLSPSLGQQSSDLNVVSVGDWVSGNPAQLESREGNVVQVGDWVTVGDSTQADWRQLIGGGQQGAV